jgi:UDP-glucose 4-epimerase
MNVLITGGAGYIGSHAFLALTEAGHTVIIFDNFSNSDRSIIGRLEKITGSKVFFIEGDVRCTQQLLDALLVYKIDSVIHFAGLKAVGESSHAPIEYYSNNVTGVISLLQAMQQADIKTLVFSSSATVYGEPSYLPLDEGHPLNPTNPYGRTKLHVEEMLGDVAKSDPTFGIVCLRYFNPIGAHTSGLIGEKPRGIPNNLVPYITQVIAGRLETLSIYGDDYETPDGTGIRDYIHIMDLAEGHVAALRYLKEAAGFEVFNLGTGRGYSVMEVLNEFQKHAQQNIPYIVHKRRIGDVAICFSDANKSRKILHWTASRNLSDMCASSLKWQRYQAGLD